jgi:hypothetical protein
MKGYVTYQDRRYRVVGASPGYDSKGAHRLDAFLRLRPFKGPDVMAPADEVQPWKRGGKRLARGQKVNIRLDINAEIIEVWEKGRRSKLTCTFTGLHQLLARQLVVNARNSRAKHIGRR